MKAINGMLLIDDFGRQKFRPDDLLNRWIVPMESKIDYLQLHTGASFPLPFDVLLIFSTNLQPGDLMDAAFLRRIRYKVKLYSPTSDEYRKIFEAVAKSHGLVLTDEIFEFVVENLRGKFDLAYYQPGFICEQVVEACKAFNQRPELRKEMGKGQLVAHVVMNRIGDKYPAGIGQGFDPCGDVDAIAIEVVVLDDHVAKIDADAQFDAGVSTDAGVPLGHRLLHRDGAAHRINDARKLDQHAVAGGLDDAAAMLGYLRVDELMAQCLEAFERAFFVRSHQPRVARHIGGEDRGETARLAHVSSPAASRRPER
jgi:hypothetical protein